MTLSQVRSTALLEKARVARKGTGGAVVSPSRTRTESTGVETELIPVAFKP